MSQPKKHPLEVFRSSSQPLGNKKPTPGGGRDERPPEGPDETAARSAVVLRLTFPGMIALVFAFILAMAAAHVYGFKRGERAARGELNAAALARGEAVERRAEPPASERAEPERGPVWYGVLVSTYNPGQENLANEMIETLKQRYGITGFVKWRLPSSGKLAVYCGLSTDAEDPELKKLVVRLHKIDDYPVGPRRPFRDAVIREHPGDPTKPPGGN